MTNVSGKARKGAKAKGPFAPVAPLNRLDVPALERSWLARWQAEGTMERYLHRNDTAHEQFRFIDGPITANNQMGVHHAWGRALKDFYQRYHTMRGHRQRYQNGFDCQGLWVEVEVEKEFGFKSKRDIEAYGIAAFVERCKERVLRFADLITEQSKRLGYWMFWDNSYFTMSEENNYTIWHFLKVCQERGLIYKGRDAMPWCPRCATGISDMEINEGRKEVQHTSLYVRFPLAGRPNEYLLAWTTTPWTLPANVAAAVNPDLAYARVAQDGDVYYLSKDLVPKLAKLRGHEHGAFEVTGEIAGAQMAGWEYTGPFDELPAWRETTRDVDLKGSRKVPVRDPLHHRVVAWKDVAATEGTGVVHIAPGCGREDFLLGVNEGLRVIAPIDEEGVYEGGFDWLSGQPVSVQESEKKDGKSPLTSNVGRLIMANLREKGLLYQTETIDHVYPHCWRCGTELVFRNVEEWFISMGPKTAPDDDLAAPKEGLRYEIMEVTRQIRWLPEFGLERELDWLRNMEDWMISKKRYWGLALPIFECLSCEHFEVIGSREELRERAVEGWEVFDGHTPHRPFVDAVKIRCSQCGGIAERVKDVGNPWLDAGIVPYSTLNYATNNDHWREWFPAEFITEGFLGQFRNWFYSMLVMSTVLEKQPPFLTVLGFATVLDHKGNTMSKSKGTAVWFAEAAEQVGADTMRWLYACQPPEKDVWFPLIPTQEESESVAEAAKRGLPVRLNEKWMQARTTLDKLWNVYSFFVTYATIDGFDPARHHAEAADLMEADRWLLAELQETIRETTAGLDDYDSVRAATAISDLVDQLSNWYIRRVRRRFWKSEMDTGKIAAYQTLFDVLLTITKLLAPFTPFFAEEIYTNLASSLTGAPRSVHLTDWPHVLPLLVNDGARAETRMIQRVVNLGRSAREKASLRVRQPLGAIYVRVADADRERLLRLADQALDELNVKEMHLLEHGSQMLTATLKPRMAVLGQRYRSRMQAILAALKEVPDDEALSFAATGKLDLTLPDGDRVTLTPEEVDVQAGAQSGFVAAEDHGLVVVLDATLTPELEAEGLVRDLTHLLNALRKKAELSIEEHIHTTITTDTELAGILARYAGVVREETLSDDLAIRVESDAAAEAEGTVSEDIPAAKLGGHAATMAIRRAPKRAARSPKAANGATR